MAWLFYWLTKIQTLHMHNKQYKLTTAAFAQFGRFAVWTEIRVICQHIQNLITSCNAAKKLEWFTANYYRFNPDYMRMYDVKSLKAVINTNLAETRNWNWSSYRTRLLQEKRLLLATHYLHTSAFCTKHTLIQTNNRRMFWWYDHLIFTKWIYALKKRAYPHWFLFLFFDQPLPEHQTPC